MTVFEAYGKLWDFFKENDSFVLEEDFRKVSLITETPSRDKAAVQSALDDWVESKMLHRQVQECWDKELKKNETKTIYILKKPLDSNEQSVSLGASLVGYISKEINDFCELIEDKTDWSDPTDIQPKDILNILHILNFYKEKYRTEAGLIDDEKK